MACLGQCHPERPLSKLLCPEPAHLRASLEGLSRSVQWNKQQLLEEILQSDERESYISTLEHLLGSTDSWLSGTAAYIAGALVGRDDIVKELQNRVPEDNNSNNNNNNNNLVGALGQLLTKDDPDVVMNAAGAIASLVESSAGRGWLLRDPVVFGQVLTGLLALLNQGRDAAVNAAALTVARLSLGEAACQALLCHPSAPGTLASLVQCLAHHRTDTAMNAAFAVGRLCGSARGRSLVLAVAEEHQLVHSLQALMSEVAGLEAGQTACFALSCLVTEEDGHALVLASPSLPGLLDGILRCFQSGDTDSAWFAAMAVKVFVSRPTGVLRVREHRSLEERLQCLSDSPSIGGELREEVDACLRKLERLAKPSPPTTRRLPSGTYVVSWDECVPESGLEVTYSLLRGEAVVYKGPQCHVTLPASVFKPGREPSLRLVHFTRDGDASPCSEPVLLATEPEGAGARLGPPQKLRVIGCTASQVRLGWAASAGAAKPRAYQLFRGGVLVDTTTNLGAIVGGLSPGTLYQLGVRALGPGDEAGPCAEVEVRTMEAQGHAPSGLTVVVLGRHELHILWGAPAAPLGRLFNYELRLNGRAVYLGTERTHTARRLSASTAYTCTVTAITSRGRCQSRPVTKRTARDEYSHTQRCLYLTTRQPPLQALTSPPAPAEVPEVKPKVTEVSEKVKKAHSTHSHLPKVHLPTRRHRWPEHGQERHRKPLVSTPSPGSETSKIELSEVSMGQACGYDVALWRTARERALPSACPARSAPCPTSRPMVRSRQPVTGVFPTFYT